jgi:hypothetical protein
MYSGVDLLDQNRLLAPEPALGVQRNKGFREQLRTLDFACPGNINEELDWCR